MNIIQPTVAKDSVKKAYLWAKLSDSDFRDFDFTEADLSYANLRRATLERACFVNAELKYVNFDDANLSSADLTNAWLRDSTLRNASLKNACLKSASLRLTDLTGADLTGADLTGADLTGAILTDAQLTGQIGLGTKEGEITFAKKLLATKGAFLGDTPSLTVIRIIRQEFPSLDWPISEEVHKTSTLYPTIAGHFYRSSNQKLQAVIRKVASGELSVFPD